MKIISGLVGLVIFFYICYFPIYLFFFNSSYDAVEQLSLASNKENLIKIESKYGRYISSDEAKKLLKEFDVVKEHYSKLGNDLSKPIYKILKENKSVTDLKIADINKEEFGTIMGSRINADSGGELYVIRCKIQNQTLQIPVYVIPPSFFKVRRAIAWTPDENILKRFYFK